MWSRDASFFIEWKSQLPTFLELETSNLFLLKKITRASLLAPKHPPVEKVEKNPLVCSENNTHDAFKAKSEVPNSEDNMRAFFPKSRRPSIEVGMEQTESHKKSYNEINMWSEQSNTSIYLPHHQRYYFSLAETGLANSSTKEEDFSQGVYFVFFYLSDWS